MVLVWVTGTVRVVDPEVTTEEVTKWRVRDISKVDGYVVIRTYQGKKWSQQ
jgi:hypothetical protein